MVFTVLANANIDILCVRVPRRRRLKLLTVKTTRRLPSMVRERHCSSSHQILANDRPTYEAFLRTVAYSDHTIFLLGFLILYPLHYSHHISTRTTDWHNIETIFRGVSEAKIERTMEVITRLGRRLRMRFKTNASARTWPRIDTRCRGK